MTSPSLTFFISAATELFRYNNDESMCMFSTKIVDHFTTIGTTKFTVQARHRGLGCVSLLLTGHQVKNLLFFLDASTMSIFFDGRILYRYCHQVLCSTLAVNRHRTTNQRMNLFRRLHFPFITTLLTSSDLHCIIPSPALDESDHGDIVGNATNLTYVDVNR